MSTTNLLEIIIITQAFLAGLSSLWLKRLSPDLIPEELEEHPLCLFLVLVFNLSFYPIFTTALLLIISYYIDYIN